MSVVYEFYLDNSLASIPVQICHPVNPPGVGLNPDPGQQVIAGGTLTTTYGYSTLINPNVWPRSKNVGYSPTIDGNNDVDGGNTGFANIAPTTFDVTTDSGKIRIFMGKLQLGLQWSDGTIIPDRWVGGCSELSWGAANDAGTLNRDMRWRGGDGLSYLFTYTNDKGIAEYIFIIGILEGKLLFTGDYEWHVLAAPGIVQYPDFPAPPEEQFTTQNISLAINNKETHLRRGSASDIPYLIAEDHYFRQYAEGTLADGGHGWSIDVSIMIDFSTGMITIPNAPIVTYSYRQYGEISVLDTDGSVVTDGNVEFGDNYEYKGKIATPIESVPKGSFYIVDKARDLSLSQILLQNTGLYAPSSGFSGSSPQVTSIQQVSSAPFFGNGPSDYSPVRFDVAYTSKTLSQLIGAKYSDDPDNYNHTAIGFNVDDCDGGEVFTLPYPLRVTLTDGRIFNGHIYIHEDCINYVIINLKAKTLSPIPIDVDFISNQWVTYKDMTSIKIGRKLGSEGDWTPLDTGLPGEKPWIQHYQWEVKSPLYLVYTSNGKVILSVNYTYGDTPEWSQVTEIADGDHPFLKWDKLAGILLVSYWRGGNAYIKHLNIFIAADNTVTVNILKWMDNTEEKLVKANAAENIYAFDWLHDNAHTLVMPYMEDSKIKVLTSTDHGETWS